MSSVSANKSCSIVILAAGAGTRMKSALPKPLHEVAGRPMLAQVLSIARSLEPVDITLVGSPELNRRIEHLDWASGVSATVQDPPRGTADAVRVALDGEAAGDVVLVMYADCPLVTDEALRQLLNGFEPGQHTVAVMTCFVDDAAGYGRIERNSQTHRIRAIVEKSVDDPARRVGRTEINSGFMVLDRAWAVESLRNLPANPTTNEFFLTDLAAIASAEHPDSVTSSEAPKYVLIGINDRIELAEADAQLRARKRRQLMKEGVTFLSPESNLIDIDVQIGADTIVGPNCVIEKGTSIGPGCRIGPDSVIRGSEIGERVRIESSTVEFSTIGDDADVGPYSHLRAATDIGRHVHIGNFAELKNASVGASSRIGHFSYVGDATLGQDVNIGAGTVTCNFDGVDKHRTEIGAGAFIGSDTMLIAPVHVGEDARTGAGAVVTKDVVDGATVVGMPARQVRRKPINSAISESEGGDR